MNRPSNDDQDATVVGFEVPRSPDSSYNSVYPGNEDDGREPPFVPPHLRHTLLNHPPTRDATGSLPLPQNVTLNHLYLENREVPRSIVALGVTHRFAPSLSPLSSINLFQEGEMFELKSSEMLYRHASLCMYD